MSFLGATGTPVLDFWWRLLWVSKPEWVGSTLFAFFQFILCITDGHYRIWRKTSVRAWRSSFTYWIRRGWWISNTESTTGLSTTSHHRRNIYPIRNCTLRNNNNNNNNNRNNPANHSPERQPKHRPTAKLQPRSIHIQSNANFPTLTYYCIIEMLGCVFANTFPAMQNDSGLFNAKFIFVTVNGNKSYRSANHCSLGYV